MSNTWKQFFDFFAPDYMKESFTGNTVAEADFLMRELGLAPGARILDVGCGAGRHSVELARRGFRMTGVDISAGQLEQARMAAAQAGVDITLIQADATDFTLEETFDAAICLCEGAFGLLSVEEDPYLRDLKILRNIAACLKSGGGFLLTALNGLALIRRATGEDVEAGRFDPYMVVDTHTMGDYGFDPDVKMREKGFTAGELRLLLDLAGFETRWVCGGTAGNWDKHVLELDEIELMVLAARR